MTEDQGMTGDPAEPVEVSARYRPDEWSEESLQAHLAQYRQKLRAMGAAENEIETHIRRHEDGSADVIGIWRRTG